MTIDYPINKDTAQLRYLYPNDRSNINVSNKNGKAVYLTLKPSEVVILKGYPNK